MTMTNDDLFALVEAVLESPNPTIAEIVKQIRNEDNIGLVLGKDAAKRVLLVLAQRGNTQARDLLQRSAQWL